MPAPSPRPAADQAPDASSGRRADERTPGERASSWLLFAPLDRFLPEAVRRHPELKRRGRLLVASSMALFAACLLFGVQMILLGQYPLINVGVVLAGCAFAIANLFILRKTHSVTIPGLLLCLEIVVIVALQAYNDLGLSDPVLLWYILVPWLAALLVRPFFGFLSAGVVTAVLGGFYLLRVQGHVFPDYTSPEQRWLFLFLQLSGIALITGFLGWVYEGLTLKNMRESNTRLRATRDALHASNERTENILESITDGFFALDQEGRLSYVNHHAEQFLGAPRDVLLGSDAKPYLARHLDDEARAKLRHAVRENTPAQFSLHHEPMGRWFELRVYPFADGLSVYFSDITKRKEYEQQLIEARDTAKHLAGLKSNFIASVSHEIRTPLSGIMGFADVLTEELEGEHREFASLVQQNAHRLLATINSVLDLSRLESGQIEIHPEPFDVVEAVEEAAKLLRPMARENGLYLRTEHDVEDRIAVLDEHYLNRILNNLVGNAVKFTDEGGVTVRVREQADGDLAFDVVDTGIGISEDFLPHLFDEFRQESAGSSRSHQGSGLGLAITYRLVDAMHGAISVESRKDVGSIFSVRLPRRPASAEASEVAEAGQAAG